MPLDPLEGLSVHEIVLSHHRRLARREIRQPHKPLVRPHSGRERTGARGTPRPAPCGARKVHTKDITSLNQLINIWHDCPLPQIIICMSLKIKNNRQPAAAGKAESQIANAAVQRQHSADPLLVTAGSTTGIHNMCICDAFCGDGRGRQGGRGRDDIGPSPLHRSRYSSPSSSTHGSTCAISLCNLAAFS